MGEINEVSISNEMFLFRPNEYLLNEEADLEVKFIKSMDTGLMYLNYFETKNGEKIMLSNSSSMDEVGRIKINKRV